MSKANFYLRKSANSLKSNQDLNGNNIKILKINTNNDKSESPYIYGHIRKRGHEKSQPLTLFPMLVDSRSETNLISSQMLQEIGLSTSQIAKTDQYNIKSSTEEVKNCILGKIEIKLELLLQS